MNQSISRKQDKYPDYKERRPGGSGALLIGLTGGIATGKSVVADMLKELGSYIIDFDVLSREVVEPEKPAWRDVVDFFGEEILQDDNSINRKKLSSIVFGNREMMRILEGFVHPAIDREFRKQIKKISSQNPKAIINAAVPLLFEVDMEGLFHKIIVVHIPPEIQIKRLIERDKISREEARRILGTQINIDKKMEYGDYIINNEGSLEETGRQVENIWKQLKKLRP